MSDREPSLLTGDGSPEETRDADTVPTSKAIEPASSMQKTEIDFSTPEPKTTTEPEFSVPKSEPKGSGHGPEILPKPIKDQIAAKPDKGRAPVVHVVGFWKRAIAALVDLAVVLPTAMLITFLVSKLTGVRLPSEKLRLLDLDLWIDLVLATDPAIVMGIVLFIAVGITYLFVFHLLQGRTLGMRLMKMRVIDVYGDRPSPARCAARCAGYLASVATLFLGFLWMGFDSEKRGLQDWLAGTYVIRA